MAFDWTTVMDSQDKSLESLLAQRDMSKRMGQMLQVTGAQNALDQQGVNNQFREKQLGEQTRLREAQMAATEESRRQATERALADDSRADATRRLAGRKPGDRIAKQQFDQDAKYINPADYEADPNDPLQFVYKRQEGERLMAKARQDEELELERARLAKETEKRDNERLAMERKRLEMAQKDADIKQQREQRARAVHEKRMAQLTKSAEATVPIHLRQQFNKDVDAEVLKNRPAWYDFESEAQGREQAILDVTERWRAKNVLGNVSAPVARPGTQPGTQPPPPGGPQKLTPKDYIQKYGGGS